MHRAHLCVHRCFCFAYTISINLARCKSIYTIEITCFIDEELEEVDDEDNSDNFRGNVDEQQAIACEFELDQMEKMGVCHPDFEENLVGYIKLNVRSVKEMRGEEWRCRLAIYNCSCILFCTRRSSICYKFAAV